MDTFDLADPFQPVQVRGALGSPSWSLALGKLDGSTVVIGSRTVKAAQLHPVVVHYRTKADHLRIRRGIGEMVEPSFREATLEPDVARVWRHAPGDGARKLPARAWNDLGRIVGHIAHGQHRVPFIEIGGGIRLMRAVGEQEIDDIFRRLQLYVDAPAQCLTVLARLDLTPPAASLGEAPAPGGE